MYYASTYAWRYRKYVKNIKHSKKKRIPIIEDACEALGAEYFGKQVGTMLSGFLALILENNYNR